MVCRGRAFRSTLAVGSVLPGKACILQKQTRCRYGSPSLPRVGERLYSSSVCLSMKNKKGKTVAKENLPSKICVVCNRPFTWRKKWERNWDEVTTCSKSCNSKRRAMAKQQCGSGDSDGADSVTTLGSTSSQGSQVLDKKALRKQHKEAVKAKKRERRLKRTGAADADVGRKACDLCDKRVDLLIRCTIDETQQFKMVCGKCWPSVSGGVPDGVSQTHPHYRYGGLWKNRNANLKKRVGSGGNKKKNTNGNKLLEEIEQSLLAQESEESVST